MKMMLLLLMLMLLLMLLMLMIFLMLLMMLMMQKKTELAKEGGVGRTCPNFSLVWETGMREILVRRSVSSLVRSVPILLKCAKGSRSMLPSCLVYSEPTTPSPKEHQEEAWIKRVEGVNPSEAGSVNLVGWDQDSRRKCGSCYWTSERPAAQDYVPQLPELIQGKYAYANCNNASKKSGKRSPYWTFPLMICYVMWKKIKIKSWMHYG